MDETVLSWTVPNWITVLLMVFIGFMIINLAGAMVMKIKGNGDA
jgi:hypothetical protein